MFPEAESSCNGSLKICFLAGDFQVAMNQSPPKEAIVSEGFISEYNSLY